MSVSDASSSRVAVFRLQGKDVQVEPSGSAGWRARILSEEGEPVSGWVDGRRAWQAVELAVERSQPRA